MSVVEPSNASEIDWDAEVVRFRWDENLVLGVTAHFIFCQKIYLSVESFHKNTLKEFYGPRQLSHYWIKAEKTKVYYISCLRFRFPYFIECINWHMARYQLNIIIIISGTPLYSHNQLNRIAQVFKYDGWCYNIDFFVVMCHLTLNHINMKVTQLHHDSAFFVVMCR